MSRTAASDQTGTVRALPERFETAAGRFRWLPSTVGVRLGSLRETSTYGLLSLAFFGLAGFLRLWKIDQLDPNHYDEGVRLEQLYLMTAGFRPFHDIFASQGPLLLDFFYPFFDRLGRSVVAARAPAILSSLVCLAAVWLVARRLGGPIGALVALAFLGLSPQFLAVSRLALAEVPSMAPACLALCSALLYRAKKGPSPPTRVAILGEGTTLWLFASALCSALALLLKPMSVVMLVPVVVVLAWGWKGGSLRAMALWGLTIAAICGLTLLIIGPNVVEDQFLAYRQKAVGLGALGESRWSVRANWEQITFELPSDFPLVAVGLAAIWPLARAAPQLAIAMTLWLAATILMLLFYSPLHPKHVSYLLPPAAVLAGGGVGAAVQLLLQRRTPWRLASVVPVGLTLCWYAANFQRMLQADWQLADPGPPPLAGQKSDFSDLVTVMAETTTADDYVVVDHPYLAYLADRRVPPRLVDPSLTAIQSGAIDDHDAIRETHAFRPKLVVFWSGRLQRLGEYATWVERDYSLIRVYEEDRAVYIRREALDRLPGRGAGSIDAEQARFGDRIGLVGVEVERLGSGRRQRVTLSWRAIRPVPPQPYVVHLELQAQDGRRVSDRRALQLLTPWRSSPWQPGPALMQRRWLDVDRVPPGAYTLALQVTRGAGGELLRASVNPSGPLQAGISPTTINAASIILE
jgi:Dolichyl-phosphate-mannose-protein mannosyltransferase